MSKVDAPRHDAVPIGEVAQAPFAALPDPLELFVVRTTRLRSLAQGSELAPYLTFLAALTDAASLGLDLLVREKGYRRGAFNPFLLGY
ncbi:MAG: FdhE protein [Hyphomicrobiales bacterium]|jgi:FdhE protein|nr:FdhE protein [Hyphomicrobiales bacterium]